MNWFLVSYLLSSCAVFIKKSFAAIIVCCVLVFASCAVTEYEPIIEDNEQTILVYMPWSDNLTSYFYQNISDLEKAINEGALKKERIVVLFATSKTEATLFELVYEKGKTLRIVHNYYKSQSFTSDQWITTLLNEVKHIAPAKRYAMIIGGHGMGWIPATDLSAFRAKSKYHWEYESYKSLPTRFFGGLTKEFQMNTTALATGIENAGIKMEYILFDDCYMSTIEVAYNLRKVTSYLIASPTEILAYGFPYHIVTKYLVGEVNYQAISNSFFDFYNQSPDMPYGTIAITKTDELDVLVDIMSEINGRFTFNPVLSSSIQRFDGYTPTIFFDLSDYVANLCTDEVLLSKFNQQLERVVPLSFRKNTEYFYSAIKGQIHIRTFSGISISEPSLNILANKKNETEWYFATH